MKKLLFITGIFLCMILAVSSISAADNDTELISSDNVSDNVISVDSDNEDNLKLAENEILSDEDDGSFTALAEKIRGASENSVIELTRDYTWSDKDVMTNGTEITVKNVTINGNNHIIDAKGHDRIFVPTASNIVLKDIVFKNGKATPDNVGWGGAIIWEGDYGSMINCTFINNTADSDTYNRGSAGAVLWNGAHGTMINSTFISNHGDGHNEGGAVYWDSYYGRIENTKFINNTHTNLGGALFINVDGDYTVVKNCTFDHNYAGRYGGALGMYHYDYVKITDCVFTNNTALYAGGAVYYTYPLANYTHFDIENSIFIDNIANGNSQISETYGGGAICTTRNANITNCTFIRNSAPYSYPGAVLAYSYTGMPTTVNIIGSTFINNTASEGYYSTIELHNGNIQDCIILTNTNEYATFIFTNVTADYNWWGNTADDYDKKSPKALGLNINKWYYLDILPNNLEGYTKISLNNVYDKQTGKNYTYDECKLPDYTFDLSTQNLTVNSNNVTLRNGVAYIDINNVIYPASITVKKGNEIYTKWIKLGDFDMLQMLIDAAAENSVVVLPRDYSYIPGLDSIRYGVIIDKNLVIDGNGHTIDAKEFTRIFDINAYNVTFKNIKFTNGLATTGGAILLWDNTKDVIYNIEIDNCTFENNVANYEGKYPLEWGGGAVYIYATNGNYRIKNSNFIKNSALNGCWGGAIYIDSLNTVDSEVLIYNSTFDSNYAKTGSALMLFTRNSNNTIDHSKFIRNEATDIDYTIIWSNFLKGQGVVNNSIILDNKAQYDLFISSGEVIADNNWWGSTADNYTVKLTDEGIEVVDPRDKTVSPRAHGAEMNNWLFLNATSNPSKLLLDQISKVKFFLQSYNPKTGEISDYNSANMMPVNLTLDGFRGNTLVGWTLLDNEFEFQAHDVVWGDGSVVGIHENVRYALHIPIIIDSEITVYNDTVIIYVGQYKNTYDLADMYRGNLIYESNDTSVLSIKGSVVEGLKEGTVLVNVTFKGSQYYSPTNATVKVIVKRIPTNLTLNVSDIILEMGDSANIGINLTIPEEFTWTTGPDSSSVKYNVTANDILSIDKNGNVKAISSGNVTVTAYYEGNNQFMPSNATFTVTISKLPSSIDVNNNKTVSLYVDDSWDIDAAINLTQANVIIEKGKFNGQGAEDEKGTYTTRTTIVFNGAGRISTSAGGFGLIVCDENGNIIKRVGTFKSGFNFFFDGNGNMAYSKGGSPQITGIPENFKVIIINNNDDNGGIVYTSFGNDNKSNMVNLKPNDEVITYTSSNESVAKVDENGKIIAVGEGTATITLTWKGSDIFNSSTETVEVTVKKYETEIDANETIILNVTDTDKNINATLNPADAGKLTYASSNESVVKVDENGAITIIGGGYSDITVKYEGSNKYAESSKTVRVIVNKIASEITADTPDVLIIGDETNINATLKPDAGNLIYESSDESIVKVDNTGKITAVGAGSATVTVKFSGNEKYEEASKTINVMVKKAQTVIDANDTSLKVGDVVNLNATMNHEGKLEYSSSNDNIVSVDENGIVTVKSGGVAEITVKFTETDKFEGAEKTVKVSVTRLPHEIDNEQINMTVFDEFNLNDLITDAEGASLEFILNQTGIVSINDGIATAIAGGIVNVTVNFAETDKYDAGSFNIIITVKKLQTTITLSADSIEMNVGDDSNIYASISTTNPNHKPDAGDLIWTVVNDTIISLNDGKVTGLAKGTANVIVSFEETPQYEASSQTLTVNVNQIPTGISVANETFNLLVGDSDYIGAVLNPAAAGNLIYEVSNSSVVSVDQKTGKITALAKGTATVTVRFEDNGKYSESSKTVTVNVDKIATEITADSTVTLDAGENTNINALLNISEAYTLNFQSLNNSVATVDPNGLITAVKGGKTTVKVTFNETDKYYGSEAEITVIVNKLETSIEITDNNVDMVVDETGNINATVTPEGAKLTYESSDESVVKVDDTGKITAVGEGSATITVKVEDDGKFTEDVKTVKVTVSKIKTQITVNDTITVNPTDKNVDIKAVLNITDDYDLTYTVEDSSVISVENGLINPKAEGTTTVTVRYAGDNKYLSSSATVTVNVEKTKAEITADEITITVDDTKAVNASISNNGKLTYEIEDPSIIKLNDDGTITALKAGETNLIIKYAGNDEYAQSDITVPVKVVKKDVKLIQNEITLNVNEKFDMTTILDYDKNDTLVFTYSIINTKMLSADGNIITALGQQIVESNVLTSTYVIVNFGGNDKYNKINTRANSVKVNVLKLPSQITVNNTFTVKVGEEINLGAILNHEGNITYASFNSSVATVDADGNVKGISVGNVVIYVGYPDDNQYKGAYKHVTVTVTKAVTTIDVNSTADMKVGDSADLGAAVSPETAGKLTYTSTNTNVVKVDDTGKITAVGKGTAVIVIKSEGDENHAPATAEVTVNVDKIKTEITVNENSYDLKVGDSEDTGASITPSAGTLTYTSNDTNVVKVENGKITAVGKGTAKVTVKFTETDKYYGSEAEITVNVDKIKTEITVDSNVALNVGDSKDLSATLAPEAGSLTYTSNDTSVVKVDNTGKITTVSEGTAKVTVKFAETDKYYGSEAEVTVNVGKLPTAITVDSKMNLTVGDSTSLNAVLKPAAGEMTYVSDNTDVVTVDKNGNIKAVSQGSAKITITFKETDKYFGSQATVEITVKKQSADAITAEVNVAQDTGVATVTVNTPKDATGDVIVTVNGKNYTAQVKNGKATVTIDNLNPGDYNADIKYSGDTKYLGKDENATIHIPNIKIDKNKDIVMFYRDGTQFVAHLTSDTKALSGKVITFKVNGRTYEKTTDKYGYAYLTINLVPKTYTITAEYKNIKVTNKITVKPVISAKNVAVKKSAKSLKIKVTLKAKKVLKNKKVTLKFKGKTYTAKTNKKGVATFTIPKSVLKKLTAGKKYAYKVTYVQSSLKKYVTVKK